MKAANLTAGARAGTVRVLIVDDEPRLRDLLADEIGDMGFLPTTARTAEEALRLLAEESFGIAVLDLQLPLMNGIDLFERIRQQWPAMQVIVLTGYGDLDVARQAIRLDVVDFLTKPCPMRDLELAMERARRRIDPEMPVEKIPPIEVGESITLADAEREQIFAALTRAGGNRTLAAETLGISRRTLHYRLNEYQRQGYVV